MQIADSIINSIPQKVPVFFSLTTFHPKKVANGKEGQEFIECALAYLSSSSSSSSSLYLEWHKYRSIIGCSLLSSSMYGGSGVYCGVFVPDDSISDRAGYEWPCFGGLTLTRLTSFRHCFTSSDTAALSSAVAKKKSINELSEPKFQSLSLTA